jgi:hypothetical protein
VHETLREARLRELPGLVTGQVAVIGRLNRLLAGESGIARSDAREGLPVATAELVRLAGEWDELVREGLGLPAEEPGTHRGAVIKWYRSNDNTLPQARWTLYLSCGHATQRGSTIGYGHGLDNTPTLGEVVSCRVARGERNQMVDHEIDRYREAASKGLVPPIPAGL